MGDQEVIVLLHIAEANGLYNRNEPVAICASLGGITLESEAIQPGQTTIFDINLVWETDKKVIKRMKTENLPIKLECFSGSNAVGAAAKRQLIGFVMIPIRGVPAIHGNQHRAAKCVPRWHKLMGLTPDWKSLKPEISMYSCIMDPAQATAVKSLHRDTKSLESIATSNMLASQLGLYVRLLPDQHCIQLGNAPDDCTLYCVHIELRALRGIRLTDRQAADQLHIQYTLFGAPSEDRLLVPSTDAGHHHPVFAIQEKINIQFRGSLHSISEYFARIFYIPIEVYCCNAAIGAVRFAVHIPARLEPPNAAGKVYQVLDRCFLAGEEVTLEQGRPWIEYELVLALLNPPAPSEPPAGAEDAMAIDLGAAGDCPPTAGGMQSPQSPAAIDDGRDSDGPSCSHPSASRPAPAASIAAVSATPKTFSYQLCLQQVRFTRKCEPGIWQLSLHHPKAHTPISLVNVTVRDPGQSASNTTATALFAGTRIELLFSVPPAAIHRLIASEPCVLNIKGPHAMFATAELDNAVLLAQAERTAGIVLLENEAREKVAVAEAFAELHDLGANLNAQQPKFGRFGPAMVAGDGAAAGGGGAQLRPHLDEELAYKMVEELEDWKSRQQDAFLVELKRREIQHLARLTAEWTRRRAELEVALGAKLEQCGQLTVALEVANKNVRDKQLEDMDRQRQLARAKDDLEAACTKRLLHLQEQARRCEADAAYEAKLAQLRYQELQLRYDQLRLENRQLRTVMAEMGAELERGGGEERRPVEEMENCAEAGADDAAAGVSGAISLTDLIVSEKAELLAEQAELLAITETLELEKWQDR